MDKAISDCAAQIVDELAVPQAYLPRVRALLEKLVYREALKTERIIRDGIDREENNERGK